MSVNPIQPGVLIFVGLALACYARPANAELIVSDLIVELSANDSARKDIEVWNDSNERSYVEILADEVLNPGTDSEKRIRESDPEILGLLVSPNRMILEPGQRKLLRIARISRDPSRERIYRIAVKPVVGELAGEASGLKVLIGYDILVIARLAHPVAQISGSRDGKILIVRNDGNSSAELVNGRQCDANKQCTNLPGKRLYGGATWKQNLPASGTVEYSVKIGKDFTPIQF